MIEWLRHSQDESTSPFGGNGSGKSYWSRRGSVARGAGGPEGSNAITKKASRKAARRSTKTTSPLSAGRATSPSTSAKEWKLARDMFSPT